MLLEEGHWAQDGPEGRARGRVWRSGVGCGGQGCGVWVPCSLEARGGCWPSQDSHRAVAVLGEAACAVSPRRPPQERAPPLQGQQICGRRDPEPQPASPSIFL